jgi:SPP1 family predicted phage head-tail adaptor
MPITTPGKMNERVAFHKKVKEKGEYGTPSIDIGEEVYSCWTMIKTQFLKEIQAAIGTELENTLTFVIRHQNTVTNDLFLVHRGIRYEIVQINPDFQYKRFDTIICKVVS